MALTRSPPGPFGGIAAAAARERTLPIPWPRPGHCQGRAEGHCRTRSRKDPADLLASTRTLPGSRGGIPAAPARERTLPISRPRPGHCQGRVEGSLPPPLEKGLCRSLGLDPDTAGSWGWNTADPDRERTRRSLDRESGALPLGSLPGECTEAARAEVAQPKSVT